MRKKSRARLTLNELMEELDTIKIHNEDFTSLTKADRKAIWDVHMMRKFPVLLSCIFCGSDANNGLILNPSARMSSWHNPGKLATIECETCNLEFNGEYGTGEDVIQQWNRAGVNHE